MNDLLRGILKEFNSKIAGDYFVDHKHGEFGYVEDGSAGYICDLEEIEAVTILMDGASILIEADESYSLTARGPEF